MSACTECGKPQCIEHRRQGVLTIGPPLTIDMHLNPADFAECPDCAKMRAERDDAQARLALAERVVDAAREHCGENDTLRALDDALRAYDAAKGGT